MTKGRLKAIGSALRLKNKFGSGYKVSMIIPRAKDMDAVKGMISGCCPEAIVEEEELVGAAVLKSPIKASNPDLLASGKGSEPTSPTDGGQTGRLVFAVTNLEAVKKLVRFLENNQREHARNDTTSMISGWGMSQTSLEDVFMRMIRN
jgi:hypothetical protein